ncbi:MAG: hypothetical protein HOB18_12010 [Nitrospina sp.]|jgi:hypothetical protein|nr:hypothetical protein [Nitrospina sp.]
MATTPKPTILARLKPLLGDPNEVRLKHKLREDLGFTDAGLAGLSSKINDVFRDLGVRVSSTETKAAKTVKDLTQLIRKKAQEKAVQVTPKKKVKKKAKN